MDVCRPTDKAGRCKIAGPKRDTCRPQSTCFRRSKQPLLTARIVIVLEFRPRLAKFDDFSKEAKVLDFSVKSPIYQIGSFSKTLRDLKKKNPQAECGSQTVKLQPFYIKILCSSKQNLFFHVCYMCWGRW